VAGVCRGREKCKSRGGGIAFENECSVFRRFLSCGLNVDFETKGAGGDSGYFTTLMETVCDFVDPFFGLTDTVTLQVPAFKPFKDVPTTLHTLDEVLTTRRLNFDVETTVSFA
jgi:hypothetical protein